MPGLMASGQQPRRSSVTTAIATPPRRCCCYRTSPIACPASRVKRPSGCAKIFMLSCEVSVKCADTIAPARYFVAQLVLTIRRYPQGLY